MSTQQFATTPKTVGSRDDTGHIEFSIRDWGDYHDVYEWLLPTKNRKQNPLRVVETIHDHLKTTWDTQETVTKKQIGIQKKGQSVTHRLMRMFRLTEFDVETRPFRYRVPDYQHYEARTVPVDADDRAEWWDKWRHIPTIDTEWVAHHWGINQNNTRKWLARSDYPRIGKQWARNRRRFARTMHTARVWTGDGVASLIEPMPVRKTNVYDWIQQYVTDSEWKPPQRPKDLPWHTYARGVDE